MAGERWQLSSLLSFFAAESQACGRKEAQIPTEFSRHKAKTPPQKRVALQRFLRAGGAGGLNLFSKARLQGRVVNIDGHWQSLIDQLSNCAGRLNVALAHTLNRD